MSPTWKVWRLVLIAFLATAMVVFLLTMSLAASRARRAYGLASVEPTSQLYQGVPLDDHLLRLDKLALEEAYRTTVVRLWGVWLSSGAPKDAAAFQSGLAILRRSYALAAAQITKREELAKILTKEPLK